jgi:hypothetical protein
VNVLQHVSEPTKHLADAGAAAIAIGTLAQVLPSIAALLTIVWLLIRIWESTRRAGSPGAHCSGGATMTKRLTAEANAASC